VSVPGILAAVVGDPAVAGLPRDTPLLSGGLGLDSVTVVRLLAQIRTATGVDVADLDLDLDALATIGTLTDFVAAHREQRDGGEPGDGGEQGDGGEPGDGGGGEQRGGGEQAADAQG